MAAINKTNPTRALGGARVIAAELCRFESRLVRSVKHYPAHYIVALKHRAGALVANVICVARPFI